MDYPKFFDFFVFDCSSSSMNIPKNITGMYAVHNKYDPGFTEDKLNYCYEIEGTRNNASVDDTTQVSYKALYQLLPGGGHTHRDDHVGSTRDIDEFFGEIEKDGKMVSRFKIFENSESLHSFLEESRSQLLLGTYKW